MDASGGRALFYIVLELPNRRFIGGAWVNASYYLRTPAIDRYNGQIVSDAFKEELMTKKEVQENESKKDVVLKIAVEAGALEHCQEHDTYFDPMDDEALERAQGQAKELVEAKDASVAIFEGNEEELIELLDDVVADAEESCAACDDAEDEDSNDE